MNIYYWLINLLSLNIQPHRATCTRTFAQSSYNSSKNSGLVVTTCCFPKEGNSNEHHFLVQTLPADHPGFFCHRHALAGLCSEKFVTRPSFNHLLSPEINWPATFFIFYFVCIVGIISFAVRPSLEAGFLAGSCLLGAFFGFSTLCHL